MRRPRDPETGTSTTPKHGQEPRDSSFAAMVYGKDPWDLSFPLFDWSPSCSFCLKQAFEAVTIFGEIGDGKSTGSFAKFLLAYMQLGMGGLICCVKPGERELIEAYARMTGRADSLIVVSPKNQWRCNLLRYALRRPSGLVGSRVEAIVSLLMTISESAERGEKGSGNNDKFWERSLRQILRNAVEICIAARGDVTMAMINEVIHSAPRTPAEVHDADWQRGSLCYRLIEEAEAREWTAREQSDFELAARYFLRSFAEMPSDTSGSILATYGVMADVLLRGHMADLFNGEATNFVPEVTHTGAIIVLDLPTKVYGQAGINVQSAFTYLWQIAAEQRDVKANPRPLMYVCDEFQDLICSNSFSFFSTARSARVASLVASQNLPNYFAALGGEAARHRVMAWLASCGTKLFHANGDVESNRFASETINDAVQTRMNFHSSRNGEDRAGGGGGESVGRKVLPSEFTMLRKGGAPDFITEAILFQTGAVFDANEGEPWMRVAFRQIIPGVTVKPEHRF